MPAASLVPIADDIARTLATLDLDTVRATYRAQDEFAYCGVRSVFTRRGATPRG